MPQILLNSLPDVCSDMVAHDRAQELSGVCVVLFSASAYLGWGSCEIRFVVLSVLKYVSDSCERPEYSSGHVVVEWCDLSRVIIC